MATMKGTVLASAVAAFCATTLTGGAARADLLDDIMKAKKIRIATDLAIPPSGMVDSAMKPTGSDVETAQLLAKDWGLELEFVQTTGATRIPNVQTNKADIITPRLGASRSDAQLTRRAEQPFRAVPIRRRSQLKEVRMKTCVSSSDLTMRAGP